MARRQPHRDQARAIREPLSAVEAEALALAILEMLKEMRDADGRNNIED
jgi:hypothetical protein